MEGATGSRAPCGLAAKERVSPLPPISLGGLFVVRERGDRNRTPRKPPDGRYDAVVLALSRPKIPALGVTLRMLWSGNAYGEILDAHIIADPDATGFQEAVLRLEFRIVARTRPAERDPRTWPMRFSFGGVLTLPQDGVFALGGNYEIDAFGAYHPIGRMALERTVAGASFQPETIVVAGPRIHVPQPPLPADACVPAGRYDAQ